MAACSWQSLGAETQSADALDKESAKDEAVKVVEEAPAEKSPIYR